MRHLLPFGALTLTVLLLTSCGKNESQNSTEETCTGASCTEQSINAPVGPQPVEEVVAYDAVASNPSRDTLRFPAFDSSWGLKKAIYDKAVDYFQKNRGTIPNPRYFTLVDFNLRATQKRLFLFDLSTGSVERHAVAAGKNSDPDDDGFATKFSNALGSEESSLGFYRTLQTYIGGHGLSLKLSGLDPTNSNAEARAIVMHPANYVNDSTPRAGRSWGCTAIDPAVSAKVIARLKNGSMMLVDR
ncbi:MAG: murein L,D-transpeptidase catalytic domain family protein [Bdellovibrionota bacterium]